MNAISSTLTTSGNSVAVRLPKQLLQISGLKGRVSLSAKDGEIVIKKQSGVRDGWEDKIKSLIEQGALDDDDFSDMSAASLDGLSELDWDGVSYEEWLKNGHKLY
jgi:antitoxin component of MazEF toxin-antitoxin module